MRTQTLRQIETLKQQLQALEAREDITDSVREVGIQAIQEELSRLAETLAREDRSIFRRSDTD